MAYEVYKEKLTKEEYFQKWDSDNYKQLTDELKEQIYNKHLVKRKVFNRDNFECQNIECKTLNSPLTLHHVKFKKNGGEDKVRNGVTLCRSCHMGYHKAKKILSFDNPNLPSHIKGHTFQLSKEEKFDWKVVKAEMNKLRKTLKSDHGIILDGIQIRLLLRWLTVPYGEWDD